MYEPESKPRILQMAIVELNVKKSATVCEFLAKDEER
jgi:hypothetical protein